MKTFVIKELPRKYELQVPVAIGYQGFEFTYDELASLVGVLGQFLNKQAQAECRAKKYCISCDEFHLASSGECPHAIARARDKDGA